MKIKQCEVAVLGAGAAGLMAAIRSAQRGKQTLLLEKNSKAGVKILMSGGTRCNLTHDASADEIADAFALLSGRRQARFLRHALHHFPPDGLVAMFAAEGLATKVESTGKIFPQSDRALDVQRTLLKMLKDSGADLTLSEGAEEIDIDEAGFQVVTKRRIVHCDKLIIAVGGRSYPGCGTTGDGYAWAKQFGHRIAPPRPALVALTSTERWVSELQGVTLDDALVRIKENGAKPVVERRGSLLFTHFGLSGPAVMDASRFVTERPDSGSWLALCDFMPSLSEDVLLDELQASGNRSLVNLLSQWAPRRLAEALVERAGAPTDRMLAELTKKERNEVLEGLKRTSIPLAGSLGFKKAEVTAGGVDLSEVDPRTMQSRLQENLFFIGEVLDLDGPIGGYNFQAAFSTGALAGDMV